MRPPSAGRGATGESIRSRNKERAPFPGKCRRKLSKVSRGKNAILQQIEQKRIHVQDTSRCARRYSVQQILRVPRALTQDQGSHCRVSDRSRLGRDVARSTYAGRDDYSASLAATFEHQLSCKLCSTVCKNRGASQMLYGVRVFRARRRCMVDGDAWCVHRVPRGD